MTTRWGRAIAPGAQDHHLGDIQVVTLTAFTPRLEVIVSFWQSEPRGRQEDGSPSNQGKQKKNTHCFLLPLHCLCPEENTCKSFPHLACPFCWYSSTAWHVTCYCHAVRERARITVKWALKLQAFKTDREKAKEMKCCSTSTSIWCQVSYIGFK